MKTYLVAERSRDPEESETEYAESEESYAESTTSEDTCIRSAPAGPPKPPRLYLESSSSTSSGPFTSPKVPLSPAKDIPGGYRCSPPTRLNSTEIEGKNLNKVSFERKHVKNGFIGKWSGSNLSVCRLISDCRVLKALRTICTLVDLPCFVYFSFLFMWEYVSPYMAGIFFTAFFCSKESSYFFNYVCRAF